MQALAEKCFFSPFTSSTITKASAGRRETKQKQLYGSIQYVTVQKCLNRKYQISRNDDKSKFSLSFFFLLSPLKLKQINCIRWYLSSRYCTKIFQIWYEYERIKESVVVLSVWVAVLYVFPPLRNVMYVYHVYKYINKLKWIKRNK